MELRAYTSTRFELKGLKIILCLTAFGSSMSRIGNEMSVSRKRLCANCRTAKTRCSLTISVCTRCKSRRLKCTYGQHPLDRELSLPGSWNPDGDNLMTGEDEQDTAPSAMNSVRSAFSNPDGAVDLTEQINNNPHFGEQQGRQKGLDWNSEGPDTGQGVCRSTAEKLNAILDFASREQDQANSIPDFLQTSDSTSQLQNFTISPPAYNTGLATEIMQENVFPSLQDTSNTHLTVNWSVSTGIAKNHPNLLHPKRLPDVGSLLTSKYLLSIIDSYPQLLCEKGNLPPFVHPKCMMHDKNYQPVHDGGPSQLPESLAICTSLVHMFYTKTPASAAYIWRAISLE